MCIKSGEDEQIVELRARGFGEKSLQGTGACESKNFRGKFSGPSVSFTHDFHIRENFSNYFLITEKKLLWMTDFIFQIYGQLRKRFCVKTNFFFSWYIFQNKLVLFGKPKLYGFKKILPFLVKKGLKC